MTNFLQNKKNKIILGIVIGLILIVSIILILTGKINLKSIMGNTAQGQYTCPEGEGYTLNQTTKKCEKKVEYEGSMVCPDDYTPGSGNSCYKQASRTCPPGSSPSQNGVDCVMTATPVDCPSGSTPNGTKCIKTKPFEYECTAGDKVGSKCQKMATKNVVCDVLNGWYENTNDVYRKTCKKASVKSMVQTTKCTYGSYNSSTKKCVISNQSLTSNCPGNYTRTGPTTCEGSPQIHYKNNCPDGGTLSLDETYCYKEKTVSYTCDSTEWKKYYTGSQWMCEKTATKKYNSCPSGWDNYGENQCSKNREFTCPEGQGYTKYYTGSQWECKKTKKCPDGYNEENGNCYKYVNKTLTCPNGGTPSGGKCYKTETIDAIKVDIGTSIVRDTITVENEKASYPVGNLVNNYSIKIKSSADFSCISSNINIVKLNQDKYTANLNGVSLDATALSPGNVNITCITSSGEKVTSNITICESKYYKDNQCVTEIKDVICPVDQVNKDGKCVDKTEDDLETIKIVSLRGDYSTNSDLMNEKNSLIVTSSPGKKQVTMSCSSSNQNVLKLTNTQYTFKENTKLNVSVVGPGKTVITCKTNENKSETIELLLCDQKDFNIEKYGGCNKNPQTEVKDEFETPDNEVNQKDEFETPDKEETQKDESEKTDNNTSNKVEEKKCPTGYTKNGNACYRTFNENATISYKCEEGYNFNKLNRKCEKDSIVQISSTGYTCQEGYDLIQEQEQNVCVKVQIIESASCPYIYINGECVKYDITDASLVNQCPNGYDLNGNICQGKTSVEAINVYNCTKGWNLNGKTCTKTVKSTVDTNKYCPSGYKLVKDKCQKTISVVAKVNYTCNSGYTLNGKTCTRTLTSELK